jgi:hypothetical protein
MTLKIIKSSEPIKVDRLNVVLYAQPGIGKSSLAFTAAAPLLLDFDNGAHRAAHRKDTVRVNSWVDVTSITPEDLAPFATVIVDTAGRALDALSADIIRRDAKKGRAGALTLQGYGTLKAEFVAWLKQLNAFGKDVILIAHMDEQRNGDEVNERLDVQGGSKNEIYKAADAMGRISILNGKRTLLFSPTDAAYGKNPGQLEPLTIPDKDSPEFSTFLAGVIASIKDRLNTLTEEQAKAQELLDKWRTRIADLKAAEDFNAELAEVKQQPKAVQAMFAHAAESAGLTFDKKSSKYVVAETTQAAA